MRRLFIASASSARQNRAVCLPPVALADDEPCRRQRRASGADTRALATARYGSRPTPPPSAYGLPAGCDKSMCFSRALQTPCPPLSVQRDGTNRRRLGRTTSPRPSFIVLGHGRVRKTGTTGGVSSFFSKGLFKKKKFYTLPNENLVYSFRSKLSLFQLKPDYVINFIICSK